uniref:MADS-box domain-containing protein n=1 Tax=Hordeum vulgare subsp. vulgare TaxID=112509 RepID=A0A8I6X0C3_HORVV
MPRTKQVMKLVENGKKRELTYKTRLGSLVRKVSQLSTLCGIDVFFVCVKPGGGGEITTWPEDRDALQELLTRFRETPPERIKENLDAARYLQGELAKGQRKLVKTRHCRLDEVLPEWDRHLGDLSIDDLNELYQTLGETLQRAQQRIAELGVTSSALAVTAPEQHGPAFPGNAFDFGFSLPGPGAGSSVAVGAQDYHYLPRDIPPQPLSAPPPYLGFHMLSSGIAFGSPLPLQMSAPSGFSFTSAGMSMMHYEGNTVNGGAAAATGFYDDFGRQGQGFGTAGASYHQDLLAYGFDAGYNIEPRAAGVWPVATPNNQANAAAYQLQNDPALWSDNGVGHLALGGQEERGRLQRFHRRI